MNSRPLDRTFSCLPSLLHHTPNPPAPIQYLHTYSPVFILQIHTEMSFYWTLSLMWICGDGCFELLPIWLALPPTTLFQVLYNFLYPYACLPWEEFLCGARVFVSERWGEIRRLHYPTPFRKIHRFRFWKLCSLPSFHDSSFKQACSPAGSYFLYSLCLLLQCVGFPNLYLRVAIFSPFCLVKGAWAYLCSGSFGSLQLHLGDWWI